MIQKFHKFANSIVLLDEVQAIPYKYWKLVKNVISEISKLFNVYFVLITATQPEIFVKDEIVELVTNKSEYFSEFDRVDLKFETESVTLSDFIGLAKEAVSNSTESFLFIFNTINSAIEVFKCLKDENYAVEYFFLATNIIPKERREIIEEVRKSKKRKVIVSTQLIEAGVDIDVENVWRDFAPQESINQVCGRCNRNFSETRGRVRIFEILNEKHNNKPFSQYIYGKSTLSLLETKELMNSGNVITEFDFLANMDEYYRQMKDKLAEDKSNDILSYMEGLQFADIYKHFKLIDDESYEKSDVFIEVDDDAKKIWSSFQEIMEIEYIYERKNRFLKIKKDLYDHVISVPAKFVGMGYESYGFTYISNDILENCYDSETGWKREEASNYII